MWITDGYSVVLFFFTIRVQQCCLNFYFGQVPHINSKTEYGTEGGFGWQKSSSEARWMRRDVLITC